MSTRSSRDYRYLLETEVLAFRPDLVVVALFVGNDLTDSMPQPSGLSFERHALARLASRSWRLAKEWRRRRSEARPDGLALPQLAFPAPAERGLNLSSERYREVEGERLGVCRISQRQAHESGWRGALEHLMRMRDASRSAGAVFAMLFIPDEFQVNPDILQLAIDTSQTPRDDVDVALPQRRLGQFCQEQGIACLDMLPLIQGRRDVYLPQDTHWNELGNEVAAEAMARWVGDLLP